MQPRGRSRVVSPVALARQASEERKQSRVTPLPNAGCFSSAIPPPNSLLLQSDNPTTDNLVIIPLLDSPPSNLDSHPTSPSKTSLLHGLASSSISASISTTPSDAHDSPPSPPQSLEDQVQVAYALDDIRLAKILLLKLKGIHVTSDSDPQIDQVRDEDFDMCFAPSGPLTLEEADKRAVQETQRKQRQWWHESQRAQRLRACERIWEDEKKRLQDERIRALRRREEEEAREEERRRLAVKQLRELTARERQQRTARARLETYVVAKREEDPFQYTFMPPTRPSSSTLPCRSPKAKKVPLQSPNSQNRSVSFKEVINAMNGKLFPLDSSERADDARRIAGLNIPGGLTCHRRKVSIRAELLDSLLQVVEWQEGERRSAKGKGVERNQETSKSAVHPPTPMPLVATSVSVTSFSSSTSPSRSSSWLSFGSWRSYATDVTTPDSPILYSSPTSSKHCILPTVQEQRELHPRCSFVRISVEESPLSPPPTTPRHRSTPPDNTARCGTASSLDSELVPSVGMRLAIVRRVTQSVATIVEAAKGLQSAYITATIFAAGPSQELCATSSHPQISGSQHQARREGYRALAEDVKRFTPTATVVEESSEPVHFIPLVAPPTLSSTKPPSAPKSVIIFPSPLRPRTPPAALAYRMRPVANPAVLRLKALQNLMCARGKEWEGRAREGGLGCGKERMLGIAFEGRARSSLGCEVRFVVA